MAKKKKTIDEIRQDAAAAQQSIVAETILDVSKKSQIPQIWHIDEDKVLHLNFHHGQTRVWQSDKRFIFMLAGTQGGKTSFGPWWLWREILQKGPSDYLAVAPSYDLFKLKMLPVMREVFEGILKIGRFWRGENLIELADPVTGKFYGTNATSKMWGRILLRSAVARGGLESTTAAAAWLDEAGQENFSLDAWEAIVRRLSLFQGRVLVTTTIYNLGWIKWHIYDPWVRGELEDTDIISFASVYNPAFSKEEFERAKRTMQDHRFAYFYLGQFAKPVGQIYPFDPETHICDPFPIPSDWRVHVGIDFGAVHTATLWVAEDPNSDRCYIYRESLLGDMTTEEHCYWVNQQYLDENGNEIENVVSWVGGSAGERQQRLDWNRFGVPVMAPTIKSVEAGIDRVVSLFKQDKLRVFADCTRTIHELENYRRKTDESGYVSSVIQDHGSYHIMDCLRYAVTSISTTDVVYGRDIWA